MIPFGLGEIARSPGGFFMHIDKKLQIITKTNQNVTYDLIFNGKNGNIAYDGRFGHLLEERE